MLIDVWTSVSSHFIIKKVKTKYLQTYQQKLLKNLFWRNLIIDIIELRFFCSMLTFCEEKKKIHQMLCADLNF